MNANALPRALIVAMFTLAIAGCHPQAEPHDSPPPPPPTHPDLAFAALGTVPAYVAAGCSFDLSFRVGNYGDRLASFCPWTVVRDDGMVIASGEVATLCPGDLSATVVVTITEFAPCIHTYAIYLDPDYLIDEWSKQNNGVVYQVEILPVGIG